MHLSDHDLRQLDEPYLDTLTPGQARTLLSKALEDLKAARERLGQNPSNSSRPPSTRAPWEQQEAQERETEAPAAGVAEEADGAAGPKEEARREQGPGPRPGTGKGKAPAGRPGRRKGAPGHSRTQVLPIDAERLHGPTCCAACGEALDESHESRVYTGRHEIDLIAPPGGQQGLVLQQTRHLYVERRCGCGHWSRAQPGRGGEEADGEWTVALSEWHVAGGTLVAFICALTQRMRLSRARVQELLHDWLGLSLSTATLNQCVHEAARALEPAVEQEILATVRRAEVLYADETSWKERGRLLWLWVFTCATATLFVVGPRTRAMVQRVLGAAFAGWLMSDGYAAYRDLDERLRCLAHLIRKARGLEECLDPCGQRFGRQVQETIATVMAAVYAAREGPPGVDLLRARHAPVLDALLAACQQHREARHLPTRALARELLNDWNTYWLVLEQPDLPLTNNEAERALRHWVIARRIGMGTRTPQGTKAFALLASVIETCRKRAVSPWPYIAEVVRRRRQGLSVPPLPQPVT